MRQPARIRRNPSTASSFHCNASVYETSDVIRAPEMYESLCHLWAHSGKIRELTEVCPANNLSHNRKPISVLTSREKVEDALRTCVDNNQGTSKPEDVEPSVLRTNKRTVISGDSLRVPILVRMRASRVQLHCASRSWPHFAPVLTERWNQLYSWDPGR